MKNLASYFTRLDRAPEGAADVAVTLTDECPEWLKEAIHACHNGALPNDWVYQECQAVCEAVDSGDINPELYNELGDSDRVHEFADSRVDVYTKARFAWAEEFCLTALYSDAEAEAKDLGTDRSDTAELFGVIQYCAIQRIACTLLEAIANAEES